MHKIVDDHLKKIKGGYGQGSCHCACKSVQLEGEKPPVPVERGASFAATYYHVGG